MLFVCAGTLGCGADQAEPEAPASSPAAVAAATTRIVVLGDSIAAGRGLPESDAFPALVERGLRDEGYAVDVINAGVSGDTSAGGLSRVDWILETQPDVVVVELGGNDALRGQPLENTEANLRGIVRRVREAGARVLLLGMDIPTNYGPEYTGAFAALYPRIATDLEVPLVAGFVREVGFDDTLMQPDGLHPTAEGHRRLAATLLPHLRRLIEEAGTQVAGDQR